MLMLVFLSLMRREFRRNARRTQERATSFAIGLEHFKAARASLRPIQLPLGCRASPPRSPDTATDPIKTEQALSERSRLGAELAETLREPRPKHSMPLRLAARVPGHAH